MAQYIHEYPDHVINMLGKSYKHIAEFSKKATTNKKLEAWKDKYNNLILLNEIENKYYLQVICLKNNQIANYKGPASYEEIKKEYDLIYPKRTFMYI